MEMPFRTVLMVTWSFFLHGLRAENIVWKVGQSESLSCQLDHGPLSDVYWTKSGRYFMPGNKADFRPVKSDDGGSYECLRGQTVIKRVSINVVDLPAPPTNLRVHNVTSRSFQLTWKQSTSHTSAVRYFLIIITPGNHRREEASLSGSQEVQERRIRTPDNGTQFTVTNLRPFSHNNVKVIAVNDAGHSRPVSLPNPVLTKSEPPSSPPVLIMAESLTSSSIRLQWLPPTRELWHGPLRGYRISHRLETDVHTGEILIDNPQMQTYEIRRLLPFRRYYISLQAYNDDGYSPGQTAVIRTAESAPGAPHHVRTVGTIGSHSFAVSWKAPQSTNGIIKGYKVYCTHPAGFTDSAVVILPEGISDNNATTATENNSYEVFGLTPYSAYHVRVTAFTNAAEGPSSDPLTVMTDTAPPGPPKLINASRVASNALLIEWLPPDTLYRQLDSYFIKYYYTSINKNTPLSGEHELEIPLTWSDAVWNLDSADGGNEPQSRTFILANLSLNRIYSIQISAATKSIVDLKRLYKGESSVDLTVVMDDNSTPTNLEDLQVEASLSNTDVIVFSILSVFLVIAILLCGLYLYFRRKLRSSSLDGDNSQKSPLKLSSTRSHPNLYVNGSCELLGESCNSVSSLSQNIPVSDLKEHIRKLYADGQIGLSREYESIAALLQCASDFQPSVQDALKPENRPKNRYVNVLPYDHSRVRLKADSRCCSSTIQPHEEEESPAKCRIPCLGAAQDGENASSDYINANYVDGYETPNAYILCQAPMPNTLIDFWRMIWDNNTRCIIMLTNVEEAGRKKSERYWPTMEQGTVSYGHFTVTIMSESVAAFYTVRCLRLVRTHCRGEMSSSSSESSSEEESPMEVWEERHLIHYLYSDWPDHGRPDMTVPLLRFISKSSQSFDLDSSGPPIVHCSAGVGRSGCYIALHSLMEQMDQTGSVNVFAYLSRARMQRMGLCQNESQYALIHDALLEYIESGPTEVYIDSFEEYFSGLMKDERKVLKEQVTLMSVVDENLTFEYARRPFNVMKNRSDKFLPTDNFRHRVSLAQKPTVMGSDYINASYLPGYYDLRQFIITQIPVESSIESFWRMLREFSIDTVIMIAPDESEVPESEQFAFLPKDESPLPLEGFNVEAAHSMDSGHSDLRIRACQIISRDVLVEEPTLSCRIIICSPLDVSNVDSVMECTHKFMSVRPVGDRRPVVVMDAFGGQNAALLCGMMYVREQSLAERSVDTYLVGRLYNEVRPGLFDLECYEKFCQLTAAYCRAQREKSPVKMLYFSESGLEDQSRRRPLSLPKRLSAIVEEDQSVLSR